ncbi:hypothetical protein E3N88_32467 [Mikania micrantha]|uniref:Uncharacterized protein n=1 Tax=Mikania micrantha TaxID=192012 RepID=A0A5N6M927_9ASTR|nr:hypothetical protein E3N88_32467 [Mikania micrantha]
MAFAYREGRSKDFIAYRDRIRESRLPVCFAYREAFRRGTIAYRDESTSLFFDFDDSISLNVRVAIYLKLPGVTPPQGHVWSLTQAAHEPHPGTPGRFLGRTPGHIWAESGLDQGCPV